MCGYDDYFTFTAADTICRYMNFTRAEKWTLKESFDIQNNYDINIQNVRCSSLNKAEWPKGCRYNEATDYCRHNEDIFLSCTGKPDKQYPY